MNTLWHKVWFDLWQNKSRTLLAVLSIAAGVFAIGTIFGLVDQLLNGMDQAHLDVAPSQISIILREPIERATAERLADIEGVSGIEAVNQLSIRYKSPVDGKWELGTLVMRPDYIEQIYDQVELKEGTWPDASEIGIERLSGEYYGISIGDEVIFEIAGEELSLPVSGQIRHPFVPPPSFGGQAHFFADSQTLAIFGIPEDLFNQLLVRVEPYSLDRAQDVAGELRDVLAGQGIGVAVTLYQSPTEHWGRMFVEGINLVLQIMAVVALVMSVILVFNSMTALITQQTNQIGIIKSVGGKTQMIIRLYLSVVLVYGLLALLLALPLSALFAFAMSGWFLNLFNIDVTNFTVSNQAVALQIIAAILMPLLAALWPVLKGASITVQEAIATYGLGADFGSSRLDVAIERLGGMVLSSSYAAALGNVFRRKGRLVLTLLVLILGGTMFLVIMSLISSTQLTLDNEMARQGYDFRIGFSQDQPISEVLALVEASGIGQEAEMWYSRNATLLREGKQLQDSTGLGAQILGIPAGSEMMRPMIAAGRWLTPEEGDGIVISEKTANVNGIIPGDRLTLDLGELGSGSWQVVGTYRVVYSTGFVTEPIYASLATLLELSGLNDTGSQLLVTTGFESLDENVLAADQLKNLLNAEGLEIDFYTSQIKLEQRAFADNQFNSVTTMLLSLALLVAVVGGIGLMGSLGTSVVERTREIGVMRAIGAGSRSIMALFVAEGILQGLMSWALAVPIAIVVARPLARQLGQTMIDVDLDFAFNWPAVLAWLLAILALALLASVLPARRAANISVRESLAYA